MPATARKTGERTGPRGARKGRRPAGRRKPVVLDCGWGRLLFGHLFRRPADIAAILQREAPGRRDVAFYVRDPHLVLAAAPQELFLDPSYSLRLALDDGRSLSTPPSTLRVRAATPADEDAINRLYLCWHMVPLARGSLRRLLAHPALTVLVAEDSAADTAVVGVVMGVDHRAALGPPEAGASLWALAVDPQAQPPGVGEALVVELAEHFRAGGRAWMDLSVMHDNVKAIALYQKLGFRRVPVYCVKRKNPINEKLFIGPQLEAELNPYAQIIVDEARKRGIAVETEDAAAGMFRLILGGRSVVCRESLSEYTSAVAMSRCDDKALTRRLLHAAGLEVPAQRLCTEVAQALEFLAEHRRVVVKPARGEQGRAVAVDLCRHDEVRAAFAAAHAVCGAVVVEAMAAGQDLRIIVIDGEVVAAAVRRPPAVSGDGAHTVAELIEKQSRRRSAATRGESTIPLDAETERCVRGAGVTLEQVLDEGQTIEVRRTANLHTGGTIEDVTDALHPALADAARHAARTLQIPVVGLDLIAPDPAQPDYVIIEANERPGLANHEPQPTAERFVDFLFPQTRLEHSDA